MMACAVSLQLRAVTLSRTCHNFGCTDQLIAWNRLLAYCKESQIQITLLWTQVKETLLPQHVLEETVTTVDSK